MNCKHPPPLTPDQLSDAIDGTAGAAVQAHLADCPSCAERLAIARLAEQSLGSRLLRWDCPPSQQIGDYDQGLLTDTEAASISSHIKDCARCTQELAELRLFMATPDQPRPIAPPQPARRGPSLGELVAQLLPRSLEHALRGETSAPLTAQAEGVTIVLDVQPAEGQQVTLMGQVAAEDQVRWTGAMVTLRQSDVLKATAFVDDLGGFSVAGLSLGTTEIRITPQTGQSVVLKDVNLIA